MCAALQPDPPTHQPGRRISQGVGGSGAVMCSPKELPGAHESQKSCSSEERHHSIRDHGASPIPEGMIGSQTCLRAVLEGGVWTGGGGGRWDPLLLGCPTQNNFSAEQTSMTLDGQ